MDALIGYKSPMCKGLKFSDVAGGIIDEGNLFYKKGSNSFEKQTKLSFRLANSFELVGLLELAKLC